MIVALLAPALPLITETMAAATCLMPDSESDSKVTQNKLPSLRVGPSKIHGQGLFAAEDIAAGAVVGWCEVVPAENPGPHTLWCDTGPVDVVCDLRFTNHSITPNVVYYDTLRVVALRDIRCGEELTYNYGPTYQPEGAEGAEEAEETNAPEENGV